MPARCIACAEPLEDDGVDWPAQACGVLCQNCWEYESDRAFWAEMGAEDKPAAGAAGERRG